MRHRHVVPGVARIVWVTAILLGCAVFAASALDVNDIQLMRQNGVPDNVIADMIRRAPELAISQEEAAQLRGSGLPENIVGLIPRTAPASPIAVQPPHPVAATQPQTAVVQPGTPIVPVEITSIAAQPARFEKEGWLTIANRDWQSYYLAVDGGAKRIFLSRVPNGGVEIDSGESVTINIRKETYKLYGDSGRDLPVKIRDGETTRLTLNPFGVVGNSGLTGVIQDRQRVRSETLFSNYVPAPTVIVRPSPVIIREAPPVVVVPHPRPYYHRPYRGYGFWYHR